MSKEKLLELARNIKDENIVIDDEARELTTEDLKMAKSIYDMPELMEIIQEPKARETKEPITIRLKSSTVKTFRGLGKGYQTKISRILDNIADNIKKTS
jgi:uncharacterized protein (DUF4415 family)